MIEKKEKGKKFIIIIRKIITYEPVIYKKINNQETLVRTGSLIVRTVDQGYRYTLPFTGPYYLANFDTNLHYFQKCRNSQINK
jgi:hypothetical protein